MSDALTAGPLSDFATPNFERGTGRPKGYYLANGDRVPSVTTIAGRFKNPRGLYWWHWNNGHEGRAYEDGGDKALEVGDLIHRTIEAELNAETLPLVPKPLTAQVEMAVGAWHDWINSTQLELIASEIPLVSEMHRTGGTLDTIVRDRHGRLCIGDWKSSKAVYPDYLIQLAGYRLLWNENRDEPITGGFHLVRFSKEHGDMEHRHFPDLADAERQFVIFREAYEIDKALEKRAR